VLQLLVELRRFGEQVQGAVHLHPLEAAALELGELLAELALLAARHGGEEEQPRPFRHGEHAVHHLAHRLRLDRQAGGGRVGHAHPRPEQAHVVVDLGDGAHGGARVVGGGLLLDGDGGRQPLYRVHVRLLHELQELPGVGGQRFDVPALPFGVDRVEGQGDFPTRTARDDRQRPARDVEVQVLEIVGPGAADAEGGGAVVHALSASGAQEEPRAGRLVFW
jgi:hypothetical protein